MALISRPRLMQQSMTEGTGALELVDAPMVFDGVTFLRFDDLMANGDRAFVSVAMNDDIEELLVERADEFLNVINVITSTNGDAKINWGAGAKTIIGTIPSASMLNGPGGAPGAVFEEQYSAATSAGTFTQGSFVKRTINTALKNDLGIGFSSNAFTPPAGSYYVEWGAPAYRVANHKSRFRNTTDSVSVNAAPSTAAMDTAGGPVTWSNGRGFFTTDGTKTYQVEHRCSSTGTTNGLGFGLGFGEVETFAFAKFWRLA